MDEQTIITRLKPILETYVEDKSLLKKLSVETDFIKDLKINSANLVDIILDVEEEFGIVIDNAAMERMLTIGAATSIIKDQIENP
jgi:acyl carrier protein